MAITDNADNYYKLYVNYTFLVTFCIISGLGKLKLHLAEIACLFIPCLLNIVVFLARPVSLLSLIQVFLPKKFVVVAKRICSHHLYITVVTREVEYDLCFTYTNVAECNCKSLFFPKTKMIEYSYNFYHD